MKRIVITFFSLMLIFSVGISSQSLNDGICSQNSVIDSKVYVCGGQYSTKFHSQNNCRGLNNCKGGIYSYGSQSSAIEAGYKYCLICWE